MKHYYTPEYRAWAKIIQRCTNPKDPKYKDYGGRGIEICVQWRLSYHQFLKDVGKRPSSKHSIGRKNNSLGYVPGNVRWETRTEQGRNKRNNRYVTYRGVMQLLINLCERKGLKWETVYKRIFDYGWTVDEAIEIPLYLQGRKIFKNGY